MIKIFTLKFSNIWNIILSKLRYTSKLEALKNQRLHRVSGNYGIPKN